MSSKAKRVTADVTSRKVMTVMEIVYILESEAKKKGFFERLKVSLQYLFLKRFDAFFSKGGKHGKNI